MDDRCAVVYVRVYDGEERRSSDNRPQAGDGDREHLLTAPAGTTLRDVLLDAGLSPYTRLTERLNCGGRGLCATCGVRIDGGPPPEHWHDSLAERWGYPRLSCQIRLEEDLRVRLPGKVIWGKRE